MSKRAKELAKLLERLIKNDVLYSDEEIKLLKSQLRVVKEELKQIETQSSKGFKKYETSKGKRSS